MPRKKYQTLTEQMFFILVALKEECCGVDIMERVKEITSGRVEVGPGTLYTLLADFETQGLIQAAGREGRKKRYRITAAGEEALEKEYQRLQQQLEEGRQFFSGSLA